MSIFNQFDEKKSEELTPSSPLKIPAYLRKVYYWAYLNPINATLLENELVVSAILWGNHQRLRDSLLKEIPKACSVLQPACVYGKFSQILAKHIGKQGGLDVIDIAPIQVEHTQRKLNHCENASVRVADASEPIEKSYDIVSCYFLIHEIPDNYKLKVINNLLSCLNEKGKLIIIDYHKPHWAHPLKPVTSIIFDSLEPYAKSLWWHDIEFYVKNRDCYKFEKETFFGGLYQKVVIQKNL